MSNARTFVALLIFVGAAVINGQYFPCDGSMQKRTIGIWNFLEGICAAKRPSKFPISVNPLPTLPISKIKGRLLTPEEGCGFSNDVDPTIVSAQTAKRGAFPWITLLGYQRNGNKAIACGGTLITSRHVLTAAHCIKPDLDFVRLGEHNFSRQADGSYEDVLISQYIVHPDYNSNNRSNDIAVLELKHDVKFTDRVRPVCLPVNNAVESRNVVHSNSFIAGWGIIEGNNKISNVLQQAQVQVHDSEACENKFTRIDGRKWNHQFFQQMLCAGVLDNGEGSCQIDSGGPLMVPVNETGKLTFYQIGIDSIGIGCNQPKLPSVYTKVVYFIDFIKSALKFMSPNGRIFHSMTGIDYSQVNNG